MKPMRYRYLAALCLGVFLAAPALAAEVEERAVRTEDVLVTATRTEKILRDLPITVEVIDEKQLRERPVLTLADALRDVPGVQVSDNSMSGVQKIKIRGESASRVLILIDGIKTPDQKSMDGAVVMMDPNFIERIEVIKGPGSVLYGSEAIGGVVNIITKRGGNKPVQGTLMFAYDSSVDAMIPKASLYGRAGGFGYRVTGTYTDADDRNTPVGKEKNTSFVNREASVYLDYQWEKAKIAFGYDYFENKNSLPGSTSDTYVQRMGLPKWQREKYYLSGEVIDVSEYLAKLSMVVYRQEIIKNFWTEIVTPAAMYTMTINPIADSDITSYGGNMQSEWTLGSDNYLIAGIDAYQDRLRSTDTTIVSMSSPIPQMNFTSRTSDRIKGDQQSLAAFVQDEWNFLPGWTATAGLRQTWVKSVLTTSELRDTYGSNDSNLVGSLGLVYSGFDDWRFRFSYAQGYRYPNLQQLYLGTNHGSTGTTYGNPDLDPETSDNFEVGVRYNTGSWLADAAVYHTRAKDYITTIPIAGGDYRYNNVNGARTTGFEGRLEYTFADWGITPYVSGGYMHRVYDYDGYKSSESGNPRWNGSAGIRYDVSPAPLWEFTADLYSRFASTTRQLTSDYTRYHTSGWSTLNLNLGARYGEEQNYFANLALNNLTNRHYRTGAGSLDEAGFNVVAQIGMEF